MATNLVSINEEEEVVSDLEEIIDLDRLKRIRTSGKMVHTKVGKKLMQAIRVGDDRDAIRALRVNYVREFDELEKRHDRYVHCNIPNLSTDDLDGEKQWIQAVIYDHQAVLAECDYYLSWTRPSVSVVSRTSSHHSSVSSRQARIHEAERKEREAELLLQQTEDEAKRRGDEDAKIRDLDEYRRRVENDRKKRELRDEMDRQRLTGAIMRQQLAELTVSDQTGETRASSAMSTVSRGSRSPSRLSVTQNAALPDQTSTKSLANLLSNSTAAPITNTPVVGPTQKSITPTRLFTQPVPAVPSTPKPGFLTQMRNLAKVFTPSNAATRPTSVPHIPRLTGNMTATSITNQTFSASSLTTVVPQPTTTCQTTTVAPLNVAQPLTTAPAFSHTIISTIPPVSSVNPSSVPAFIQRLPPAQSSAPTPLVTPSVATSLPSWRNVIIPVGPTSLAQQSTPAVPGTSQVHLGGGITSTGAVTTPAAFYPGPTQTTAAIPVSGTSFVPVNPGPSHGPAMSAYVPTTTTAPTGNTQFYAPMTSITTTNANAANYQPTSFAFPTNIYAPFPSGVASNPAYVRPPTPIVTSPTTQNCPTVIYTPDAWIHELGTPYATTNRSGVKLLRMKVPSFNGDPQNWPMFIQMFKVFIHDAVGSDAERIAHLHDALTPEIRKNIGGALLNPGLYQHALNELHKRYGNPQIVSQACTSSLLKLRPFKDNDFNALRSFSADLHSVVATLRLGGYGMELHSHATLSQLVSKLPPALKSRWGEKSWAMQPTLASVEDLDQWIDGVTMAEQSIRASSVETTQQRSGRPTDEKRRQLYKPNVFNTTTVTSTKPLVPDMTPRCPGCNSKHQHCLKDCRQFRESTVERRAEIVKEKNLCLRCLGNNHLSGACTRTQRCTKPNCDGVHHPLLHGAPRLYPKKVNSKPATSGFSGSVATKSTGRRTLLPIVPIILKVNGTDVPLYALLDPGSEISVIKYKTAALLNLHGRVERVSTKTVDGESKAADRELVDFDIVSRDGHSSFGIVDVHVMDTRPPQAIT